VRKGFRWLLATAVLLASGNGPWGSERTSTAQAAPNAISSFGQSISNGFKSGVKKLSDAVTPDPVVKPAEDPVSLHSKSKPSPELYISLGLLAEQKGNFPEAERRYQAALKLQPNHLGALLAYARLKDRQNQFAEAVQLYQQALQAHPNEAVICNDLGLCYARNRRLQEARPQLERAVQLKPKEILYRNNLATLLVEMGDVDRAFQHFVAVHGEAVAYYNLGYLMQKKGESKAAAVLFAKALEKDPSMDDARTWLEALGGQPPPRVASGSGSPSDTTPREATGVAATQPPQSMPNRPMPPVVTRDMPTAPLPESVLPMKPGQDLTVPPSTSAPRYPLPTPSPTYSRASSEARRLPPVPQTSEAPPSPKRLEDAPMPPAFQGAGQGLQFQGPTMAPLPPGSVPSARVHPLPSTDEVLVEP